MICTDAAYENPLKAVWDWEIPLSSTVPYFIKAVRLLFRRLQKAHSKLMFCSIRQCDSPVGWEVKSPPCVEFTTYAFSFTQTCNDLYRIYSSNISNKANQAGRHRAYREGRVFFYVGRDEEYWFHDVVTLSGIPFSSIWLHIWAEVCSVKDRQSCIWQQSDEDSSIHPISNMLIVVTGQNRSCLSWLSI